MANRRKSRPSTALAPRVTYSAPPRTAPQQIVIRTPNAGGLRGPKRRGGGRRRPHGGGGGGGMGQLATMAATSVVVGMAVKSGVLAKLPNVPVLGRLGVAAIGLWWFGKNHQWARNAALSLATVAAYQFGSTQTITGDD